MFKILQSLLAFFARKILQKYKSEVVGITGSIGKTSAKEAIYTVLSWQYNVRQNIKSYNNELGLPLTIIGAGTGGRSVWKWIKVFYQAIKLLIFRDLNYPQILVLEMGADKFGDIAYLVSIAKPKVGIFTGVAETHLYAFKDLKGVLKEKEKIVTILNKEDYALLNADDENIMGIKDK